jgi:hypothetical protein
MHRAKNTEIARAPTDSPRMNAGLVGAVVQAAYILDAAGRR